MDDKKKIGMRIRAARKAAGFRYAREAAEALAMEYPTYAGHENGSKNAKGEIEKYARRFGVSIDWLLTGKGKPPKETSKSSDILNHHQENGLRSTNIPIGFIKVTGKVAANTWLDVDEMDFGYDDIEYVPSISGHPEEQQFALIVDGNCLNKIAPDGTVLACLRLASGTADVLPNDLVIVERRRFGGQMVERTAKRVRQTLEGFELWPESTDPAHQEPIRLSGAAEGEEIVVIGKVLWVLRKP